VTDLQALLETTGLPVAAERFRKPAALPFIIWTAQDEYYGADHSSPLLHRSIRVELYAEVIDLLAERRIAAALDSIGASWTQERLWLEDVKLRETVYLFELEEKRN